jgi:polyketide biosynthesis 3-hydroxy-3-methylglutaryl-CoA synthase-like enzyme PksG
MQPVGIEAMSVYTGRAVMSVPEIFAGRGLDASRTANLMMRAKSVALPCEDPVTNAVNAAWPIIDALPAADRARIELLAVATESGIDLSKTLSSHVQRHLGLPSSCRVFEVKQACYAGMAALQVAAATVAFSPRPGTRALIITADIPHPVQGSYYEPSQGVGSVAVLVSDSPTLARFTPGASGYHSFEVTDSCRPSYTREVVDTDVSLLAYLECLHGAFLDYADRNSGADIMEDFDLLCMHTPFAGMVKGAHRTLLRKLTSLDAKQIEQDYVRRVEPSIHYGQQMGNIYSGSVLLAFISSLANSDTAAERRVGLFSYGSGCASEFTCLIALPGPPAARLRTAIDTDLARRVALDWAAYERLADHAGIPAPGTADYSVDAGWLDAPAGDADARPYLALAGITDYRREYRWTGAGR